MRADGTPISEHERIERMSQIRTEVDDIVTAVEHLSSLPEVRGWESLFERIQKGPLFAAAVDDKAREAQVELLMGAIMRSTGAEVSFREPDAHAIFQGHSISFAAKRPSSASNFRKTVKDGRNQLHRAGGVGVLFLDLSQLAQEHSQVRRMLSHAAAIEQLAPPLYDSVARLGRNVRRWVQSTPSKAINVLAAVAIVRARFVVQMPEGLEYGTIRRLVSGEVTPEGISVPSWIREFTDAFAAIGRAAPSPLG
jgi:hypothetical protein